MSWIAVAILGGAAIGGGASLLASKAQGEAIEEAAATGERSTAEAIEEQRRQFDLLLGLQAPFTAAGTEALPQLSELAAGRGEPIQVTDLPTFGIQQEEGERGINRALAGRGIFGSRAGVGELSDFNRRLLAEETGRESERRFGRLLDLVNIGRGTATTSGSAAQTTGTNISNLITSGGQQQAGLQQLAGQNRASTFANLGQLPLQTLTTLGQFGQGPFGGGPRLGGDPRRNQ